MSRLPFLFIVSGMIGFTLFHAASLLSLAGWLSEPLRGPAGWFHIHLFVLGWATMVAMGAVYQLITVILQTKLYSERLGYIHYVCFTAGIAGLLPSFFQGNVYGIGGFALLAFAGILLFAWNMAATLHRASRWNAVTVSAACAVGYLALTGLTGLAMGVNFATGWWDGWHDRLFGAHIWLGTVGWFGLLITGFSYKLLPMFCLAHGYPVGLQRAILLLWNAAVLIGAISFLAGGTVWAIWSALLLLTAAIVVYAVHLLQIQQRRHKRNPGAGIRWAMHGNRALGAFAVAMLLYTLWFPEQLLHAPSVLLAGWVYLGGWVSFTILCYLSKIVPFLWWTRTYGGQAGTPGVPIVSDLLNDKRVNAGLAAIACSVLLAAAGILMDAQYVVAIGGSAYAVFSVAYIGLIGSVFAK